ncbi:MAG: hypothetical protein ACFWUE_09155 [Xylanivirga thermophila]|jgi:anti-sigma28 factor (negative regulator of flagellin synthesis)|uniref:hypothetical protein n=1 Tax=Xylanivirga thermophila TaxID=2496273 RepID=UPI00101C0FAF|nr:hypothetical protein [Xylanivirga thermophila]
MNISNQDLKNMQRIAQEMQGKPENEVIEELSQMIKSGQLGVSTQRAIEMLKTMAPMLDQSQRRKIQKLINRLMQ